MPYNPELGVGSDPRPTPQIYNSNQSAISLSGAIPANDADNTTLTITINRSGRIAGFLGVVSMRSNADGAILVRLRRNGQLISSTYLYGPTPPAPGIVFLETLGMLAGAEVVSGDTFTLALRVNETVTSGSWVLDAAITLVVQEY